MKLLKYLDNMKNAEIPEDLQCTLLGASSIWTNDACYGYIIMAMEDAGYIEVKDCEPHTVKAVRDRFGNQWHYCIKCQDWFLQRDMASYLGAFGPVKGECKQCNAKKIAEMRKRMGI